MSRNELPSKRCGKYLQWCCCALLALIAYCSWLLLPVVAAEFGEPDSARTSIEYRRIFVPAEKMDAWPREGEKYLPVESADFDRWVEAANKATSSPNGRVTITNAEYAAHLEND